MPVKLWLGLLRKQLTGKALTAYKEISLSPETPYLEVKQMLLERMGATARQARRTYWLKKPKQDEGPESFLEQALCMITRVSTLMTTPQQVQRELFKGLIYCYFSEEAILLIEKCQEESLYRMSQEIVQLWQSKDGYARKKFMPMETPQTQLQHRRRDGGHDQGGNRWNKGTSPTTTNNEGESPNNKGGVGG